IYSEYYHNAHTFFGYYDITPFSKDDKCIIFIRTKGDKADICLMEVDSKNTRVIGHTNLWNWQQGCRLRWVSDDGSISFNDIRDNHYCNVWKNVKTKQEIVHNYPIYDISFDESLAATLDFERLGLLRPGYGYRCLNIPKDKLSDQALSLIDIKSGRIIKTFSLSEIRDFVKSNVSIQDCYINHVSFSPYGKKLLFFFIEIIGSYHKASLLVYDYEKDKLYLLDGNNKASHYVWKDADTIICTSQSPDKKWGYYVYSIDKGTKTLMGENILIVDGHPSIFRENGIITDSYPDRKGFQRLYKIEDISNLELETLVEIYSVPVKEVEKRTDLHPRLSHKEDMI
ncbi:MAG: hypothetical protein K2H53_06345, partial [Clostridia bacterium]|nr:hypothetical protein [Clostridia bacterium]